MFSRSLLNGLAASTKGNISTIMAFSLVPLMVFAGAATDHWHVSNLKISAQRAADAASLAVVQSDLKIPDTVHGSYLAPQQARVSIAQSLVKANMGNALSPYINRTSVSSPGADGRVTVKVDLAMPTAFASILGIKMMHATVSSTAFLIQPSGVDAPWKRSTNRTEVGDAMNEFRDKVEADRRR